MSYTYYLCGLPETRRKYVSRVFQMDRSTSVHQSMGESDSPPLGWVVVRCGGCSREGGDRAALI